MPPITVTIAAASSLVKVLAWHPEEFPSHLFINPAFAKFERPELDVAYCAVSPAERFSEDPFALDDVLACTDLQQDLICQMSLKF